MHKVDLLLNIFKHSGYFCVANFDFLNEIN